MALLPHTRVGAYEILDSLGAGGMGEVYRARDPKLGRDVALKILPNQFADDPERLARFEREAHVLASLNHPNIATIYGLEEGEAEGGQRVRALVLELVEGPTLAERMSDTSAPLALDEALSIARQIGEALEVAHERGIIHRDLKPANVKVTPQGTVKVLDFGLAAVAEDSAARDVNATHSPTLTLAATRAGMIMGTAAYMSPEQASGKAVDKRADIWSFGVVLWEMLTRRQLFEGETISHTLAFVLTKDPDWSALPANTPESIQRLLRRCLEKDRRRRLPDIGTARLEIDEALDTHRAARPEAAFVKTQDPAWRRAIPWVAAGVGLFVAVATLVVAAPWRSATVARALRVSMEVGADVTLAVPGAPNANIALSPNGEVLAFVAQKSDRTSQLYLRKLDQLEARALSGTEGATGPFFSPDGEWIGFFADGKLKKISATGGAAVTLAEAAASRGAAWSEDGTIVYSPGGGVSLHKVSSAGGKAEQLLALTQGESSQRWPQMLAGGRAVLFTSNAAAGGQYDDADIVVQSLPPNGPRKILQRGGYFGRYLSSGHLLYIHGGTVFAAPFDLDRFELTGQPVPMLENVNSSIGTGAAQLTVAQNGLVVYRAGAAVGNEAPVAWLNRTGSANLRSTPADWSNPAFSPDGSRLAMDITTGGNTDVWVYELARDTLTRLTFDPVVDVKPVWTPDGKRIAFASVRANGVPNLYWRHADGTGEEQQLTEPGVGLQLPGSWHPSGKFLAFQQGTSSTGTDIMILPMEGDEATGWKPGKPTSFLNASYNEAEPMFSPDGRWIAYQSNESGQLEIYVRPFPGPGGKWQVSTGGGSYATWSPKRNELFYSNLNQQIMVASYTTDGQSFHADKPRVWSEGRLLPSNRLRGFALHPDGARFATGLIPATQNNVKQDKVVVILNFGEELRRATATR